MAQVPYAPVPTQSPSGQGTPELRIPTNPDAFGVGVGHAIEKLGGTMSHVGDEVFARGLALQKLQNETLARQADTDYMLKAGELHAKFSALEGEAAVAAYPQYAKDLQDARVEIRSKLPNLETQRMYDSQSLSTMGRSVFNGAGHSATEQKKWTHGVLDSQDSAVIKSVDDNPTDQRNVDTALETLEQNSHQRAALRGWSDVQREDDLSKRKSILVSQRIMSIAKSDPEGADKMLTTYRDQLYGDDKRKVENLVQANLESRGSAIIASKVMSKVAEREDAGKPMSMKEAVDAATKEAERIKPDDSLFAQNVRRTTEQQFNTFKRIRQEDYTENRMTVESGLAGLNNKDGRLPTTMVELTADPKTAQAIDWMKQNRPDAYRSVQNALTKNSKGDVVETPERLDTYHKQLGLSQTSPADFLDTNISSLDISNGRKTELIKLQMKMQNNMQTDPRVGAAMRQLEPSLRGAGITMQTKDDYVAFKGSLMAAMQAYREENKGKSPTADEVQKIGARLLQERTMGWSFNPFSGFQDKQKLYSAPVPDEVAKIIREDPAWQGVDPTPEQVKQIYIRQQFRNLYGGTAKSSGGKPTDTTRPPRE